MDVSRALESPTLNSAEDLQSSRALGRGILKKKSTFKEKAKLRRSFTQVRKIKVSFADNIANRPICTVYEIEPIKYDEPESPKGQSCVCIII